jgi:hypothetical protein
LSQPASQVYIDELATNAGRHVEVLELIERTAQMERLLVCCGLRRLGSVNRRSRFDFFNSGRTIDSLFNNRESWDFLSRYSSFSFLNSGW